MAWLLVGSIPGVLHRLAASSIKVPERGLRVGVRLRADPLGDQGRRRSRGDLRDRGRARARRARARWSGASASCCVRRDRRVEAARAGVESPGRGPGALDRRSRGAARGDGGRVRAHRGREDRARARSTARSVDEGLLAGVQLRARPSPRSTSGCGSATHLTVWMERDGKRVRTLVPGRSYPRGPVTLAFDGLSDGGLTLPDGVYRPVVRLGARAPDDRAAEHDRRSTRRRRWCASATAIYTHISPDGDGRNDVFRIRVPAERARRTAILLVDGRQDVLHALPARSGRARPGTGRSTAASLGPATTCSRSPRRTPPATARSRSRSRSSRSATSRSAGPRARPARRRASRSSCSPTRRRSTGASTGAAASARPGTLRLRAPRKRGVYRLYVTAAGHAAKALRGGRLSDARAVARGAAGAVGLRGGDGRAALGDPRRRARRLPSRAA